MLGEHLEPQLPKLAALQRQGAVSVEKVQIVERAMHKLIRPGLDPAAVETAERLHEPTLHNFHELVHRGVPGQELTIIAIAVGAECPEAPAGVASEE